MKTLKITLLLSLSILLYNCSDSDEFKFDTNSLKQTSWSGTRTQSYNGGEVILHSDVGIIFYTEDQGQYDIKYKDSSEPERTNFIYSIDGKMMYIKENVTLKGYWLLIENGKNKMVLEQSSGGEFSYKETMTLIKNH